MYNYHKGSDCMPFIEKKQFQYDDDRQVYAFILRQERIKKNLSVRALANQIGITPQFLSDIEHNKKQPSAYAFHQLQKALNIHFYTDEKYCNEIKNLCNQMFEAYIALNHDTITEIHEEIVSKKDIYMYCSGTAYFILSMILHCISVDIYNKQIYDYIEELKPLTFSLETNDIVKFYDLCGYQYLLDGKNKDADFYFRKALDLTSVNYIQENAILYSHLSIYYQMTNRLWEALNALDTSTSLLSEICAFHRITNNQMKKANLYSLLKFYIKAIEKYKYLIHKAPITRKQKAIIYDNLANCYLHLKDFDHAMECCEKAQLLGSTFSATYFNIAYIYWKKKKYKECLAYIALHIANDHICEIDKELLRLLKYHIQNDKEKVYTSLDFVMQRPEKDTEYKAIDTIISTIDIAIEIMKSYNDYEQVIHFYELKEEILFKANL